ncbi:MAG: bifunctional UDP-N-acetylglucosamine diphosphorylase/glucosamine-1-phosphate N-acetyltransferase GlmU [Acutalibacteraceae bacterium]|nr:bifunctional UDP-N-acetylglucosamine diphosphorylase/glucosamine-1-phosphate N-acetyltransferase GlmU [Acutalibacteraceae bacterium]
MGRNCALILAAGEGKRMKTSKPKALAEVLFKPMIDWVTDAAIAGGVDDICIVTGHGREALEAHLGGKFSTVEQKELLGTGHAVMQAKDFIKAHTPGDILILNGDAPLIDAKTISTAYEYHNSHKNAVTIISAKIDNPAGYGRIIRNKDKCLKKIVEENDANNAEKMINEVNSGAYWFNCSVLLESLEGIVEMHDKKNQAEYYLTDAIEVILEKNLNAVAYEAGDPDAVLGANDRVQLQKLNEIARKKVMEDLMLDGVSIPCADGVMISPNVKIGAETEVLPGTIIKGNTVIGEGCVIGPNSFIENSVIGDNVTLNNTQCYSSTIKNGTSIGPFARVRPDCVIGEEVKAGNFVEFKNAKIGDRTSVSHLSYIGDADFGSDINVGCGCATVNYNGKEKNRTKVDDHAFIGCSTYLVAPVSVGKNSYTAAGSVITEDVPDNALAIARSRQTIKKDWISKKKPYKWQK